MPESKDAEAIASPKSAQPRRIERVLVAVFLLVIAMDCAGVCDVVPVGHGRLIDGVLILFASALTVAWLTRRVPLQNVLAASGFMALLFAAAQGIRGIVALQPSSFAPEIGPQLGGAVPWLLLPLWVLALLNAQGVARVLLRHWRRSSIWGLLVIGLSAVLFALFELGLEGYGAGLKSYWTWEHGLRNAVVAPMSNYFFWCALALAAQVVVAPWLINKKPGEAPLDSRPLVIWISLLLLLGIGSAAASLWVIAIILWGLCLCCVACALFTPAHRVSSV